MRLSHERTVNHHPAEAFAPWLLKDEHQLGYLVLRRWIGEAECLVEGHVEFQRVDEQAQFRCQRSIMLGSRDEAVDQQLEQFITRHASLLGQQVEQLTDVRWHLGSQEHPALVFILLVLCHCVVY